jgi:hypothetical protein
MKMSLVCQCNWHSCRGEGHGDVCWSINVGSSAEGARHVAWILAASCRDRLRGVHGEAICRCRRKDFIWPCMYMLALIFLYLNTKSHLYT